MIRIFVEPTDVLIFRTGLPFDAGANSYAPGIFPPSPEPLQGALREYLARALAGGRSLTETFRIYQTTLGDRVQPGRFRMRGPFLARRNAKKPGLIERLYPPPADLVVDADSPDSAPRLLQPVSPEQDSILTAWPNGRALWRLRMQPASHAKVRSFPNWLTNEELATWQSNDHQRIASIKGISLGTLWQSEPRIGLKHDPGKRVVADGFLYQMEFVRLSEGVGLDIDIWLEGEDPPLDLSTLLQEGWGRLGGEGRTARYTLLAPADSVAMPSTDVRHKLYLATPAALAAGWQPANGDWSAVASAAPVAVALPRYVSIGGWSMQMEDQDGDHKPMHRHVPAGSVYYFNQPIPWTDQLRLTDEERKRQIGYGVCYVGAW